MVYASNSYEDNVTAEQDLTADAIADAMIRDGAKVVRLHASTAPECPCYQCPQCYESF